MKKSWRSDSGGLQPISVGYILDGVSATACATCRQPPRLPDPPRMIGFALWGTAAEEGLGLKAGAVMEACRGNIGTDTPNDLGERFAQEDHCRRGERRTAPGSRRKRRTWLRRLGLPGNQQRLQAACWATWPTHARSGSPRNPRRYPTGSSTGCGGIVIERVRPIERNITTHSRKECHALSPKKLPPSATNWINNDSTNLPTEGTRALPT